MNNTVSAVRLGNVIALAALLADHETLIRNLRRDLAVCSNEHGDEGTMDFLTGRMQVHEKTAWMLRAYLR